MTTTTTDNEDKHNEEPDLLYKLMGAYIVLGFVGFLLILLFLDKIGARVDPEKSAYELICQHVSLMFSHKTFRLLIPLLVFTGLQQGFIYADFNRSYVTCTLGIDYVGYCMITMGLANVLSSVMVALCAKYIPREVVLGFGGVVHIGLMIGFLIWIPEKNLLIFFILAASWGVCDAVWQTQCNSE
ncbi:protein unc-93 homolog A-like [Octopus sinensis]|uniref:Protein unc-93 homolog A-like n=1 Tax=Octopus sinensis TaxID=2607531 RepID=A0A7E6FD84_9MOLL|nr:protein unc-93 homolog A-like [Octopus sinensis]